MGKLIATRTRRLLLMAGAALIAIVIGLLISTALGGSRNSASSPRMPDATAAPQPTTVQTFDPSAARAKGLPAGSSIVAHLHASSVRVYRHPGSTSDKTLHALQAGGHRLALVLLVRRRRRGWLDVDLPTRPDLSTGWIRATGVSLQVDPYSVRVNLTAHRVSVFRGTRRLMTFKAGVGRSLSPTPDGRYFIADLLRPPSPDGVYGPYAFGLSAYSDVYTSFAGGDGQIGLHGTDEPQRIGTDVSHGCIRISDGHITTLAHLLPLGTPVTIRRTPTAS